MLSLIQSAREEEKRTMKVPNDADRAHGDVPHMCAPGLQRLESQGKRDFTWLVIWGSIIVAISLGALLASHV